jgi:hypothetical protein
LAISGTNSMYQLLTTTIIYFFNHRYCMLSFFFLTLFIYLFIYLLFIWFKVGTCWSWPIFNLISHDDIIFNVVWQFIYIHRKSYFYIEREQDLQ